MEEGGGEQAPVLAGGDARVGLGAQDEQAAAGEELQGEGDEVESEEEEGAGRGRGGGGGEEEVGRSVGRGGVAGHDSRWFRAGRGLRGWVAWLRSAAACDAVGCGGGRV